MLQFRAAVLHINPTSKDVTLTQLPHLVTPDLAPRQPFGTLAVGDVVDEVVVQRVDNRTGVYVKLSERVNGLAYVSEQRQVLSHTPIPTAASAVLVTCF